MANVYFASCLRGMWCSKLRRRAITWAACASDNPLVEFLSRGGGGRERRMEGEGDDVDSEGVLEGKRRLGRPPRRAAW